MGEQSASKETILLAAWVEQGDEDALAELLLLHRARLCSDARRTLGPWAFDHLIDDVLAHTGTVLALNGDTLRRPQQVTA